jgi:hypothetical protein
MQTLQRGIHVTCIPKVIKTSTVPLNISREKSVQQRHVNKKEKDHTTNTNISNSKI